MRGILRRWFSPLLHYREAGSLARTALQKLNRPGAGTQRPSLDKDAGARTVSATILFIDIVGSTAQAAELGNRRWSERVARYFALVRRELRNYSGTEVHTNGDGFLVLFDAPTPFCHWLVP